MSKVRSTVGIRRVYEKMAIATSLEVLSGGSGLTQSLEGGEYSPDRSLNPLVLSPRVTATATDVDPSAVWTVGDADNSGIGGKAWLVGGVALSQCGWTAGTDYELKEDGKQLWVYKNLPYGTTVDICCKLLVRDSRTGVSVECQTDSVTLATVAVSDAHLSLQVDRSTVLWCPEADDLLEWEYREARGLTQKMTQAAATNDACYKKEVKLVVTKNGKPTTDSYSVIVTEESTGGSVTLLPTADSAADTALGILELTKEHVVFDCRVASGLYYDIRLGDAEGTPVPYLLQNVSVEMHHRDYDLPEIVNFGDYMASQTSYADRLRVRCNGEEWDYPEIWLDIEWKAQPADTSADEVWVGSGNTCLFDPNAVGGGVTEEDNGFELIAETDYITQLAAATDENGDIYTDEEGNVLLIA